MMRKAPFFAAIGVLAADMLSKLLTHLYLPVMNPDTLWYPYGGVAIFRNLLGIDFSLSHATNKGAAWGIMPEHQDTLLIVRILCILALIFYVVVYNKNRALTLPFSLIIAGAVGNIIDYFFYGHVVDMFYFVFWSYSYPVFNIADASIFTGIFWLLFASLFSTTQESKA